MTKTSTNSTYDLHARLGFRLNRLSKLMKLRLDQKLAPLGVSRIGWCVLSGVGLQYITTPSELASHIGVTRQAMSRLLLQMRKDGLLEQSFSEDDGRSRQVSLTPKGVDTLNRCRPLVDENQAYFAGKLSPQALAAFDEALNVLLAGDATELDDL